MMEVMSLGEVKLVKNISKNLHSILEFFWVKG